MTAPTPAGASAVNWPIAPVAAAFVLLFAAMTWKWLSGAMTIPWDAKAHFQPQIQFLAQSIARGEWPWWNPYVFSGQPQIADPQSMLFSPPFVLLALIDGDPSLWAVDVTVLATMALGGIGLIVYFRDRGWHWAGALVAALVLTFGAAMAWRLQHFGQVLSLAYLPWALVCLARAIDRPSILFGALSGVVAAFIMLGRDQVALLAIYLLAAYGLWLLARDRTPLQALRRAFLPLAAGTVVAIALITLPILMTVLLAAGSNRPEISYDGASGGSLHPALLLSLVMPDIFGASGRMGEYWGPPSLAWPYIELYIAQNVGQMYVGALPLLLVATGLLSGRLWHPEIRFFTIALALMLLYALGSYTPIFRLIYEIAPGISLYRRPADAVFLIGGILAILSGYMTHRMFVAPWIKPSRTPIVAIVLLMAVAALVAIGLGIWLDRLPRVWFPIGLGAAIFSASAIALAWARSRIAVQPVLAALVLAVIVAADLGYNNGNNGSSALPPEQFAALEPGNRTATISWLRARVSENLSATRRDRIELAGLGFHWPNASMTHRLENTLGYNPVRLGIYSRATGAQDHIGLPDQRQFAPLMPSYRSPLSDLLGLRYIAAGAPIETIDKSLKPGDLPLVHRTPEAWIYENPRALPRVLFATRAVTVDFEVMLALGGWPSVDLRSIVLLEEALPDPPPRRPGTAAISSYANTRVEVDADSADGGFVVLNDIWHPWWTADIDGHNVQMLRANVLFRAVAVPPGRHRITFVFDPIAGAARELSLRFLSPRPREAPLAQ